jgi:uncharacterized C2H2 Zn-finger protein
MTFAEVVAVVRAHVEAQFPKTCPRCARVFDSLPDYLRETRHVGAPHSYDFELGERAPADPVGTYSVAVCPCGTSMSIGARGLSPLTFSRLMVFAFAETRRRGLTIAELLTEVRDEIDRQVLARPGG